MGRIKKSKNKEINIATGSALQELLNAIKSDDLILFSRLISDNKQLLSLCYGHFPILSMCYLYQSKKIVKAYEKDLSSISNYDFVAEDFEVYKRFKQYAKRCLRFYYLNNNTVTPLEMLAILNDSYYLKQVYGDFPKPERVRKNIAKIYSTLHNQDVDTRIDTLTIKRKPMSKMQKVSVIVTIVFAVLIIGISFTAWKGVPSVYGRGTADAPYRLYNEKQLVAAFKDGEKHYVLAKDITLTKNWTAGDFKGTLDGNGNKIYAKDFMNMGFIDELTGIVENVDILFSPSALEITEDFALVVKTNNGQLQNISIDITGNFFEQNKEENLYFSLLVNKNYGEINTCTINDEYFVYGKGTINEPNNIYNERQFISAFKNGDKHYKLAKDITLTKNWTVTNFKGTLDGNGNKIYAKDFMNMGFIDELTGIVENVDILFSPLELEITENFALLVKTNNGHLQNVSIDIVGEFLEKSKEDEVYLSLFAYKNYGEIINCTINADITIQSDNEKNAFFSGFASFNSGNILNCNTTSTSKFQADTVDLSGFVANNERTGTVSQCVNEADILQTSKSEFWNPNASGIVINNYGLVSNCTNNGNITAVSKAADKNLSVYVGGIVCINNSSISKSKNTGDIMGISNVGQISAGGIASVNNTGLSVIENCSVAGLISIILEEIGDETFTFAGSMAGFNDGSINNSFSSATFESANGTPFIGGIASVANNYIINYSPLGTTLTFAYENNFFVKQSNISFGSGTVLINSVLYGGVDDGTIAVENEDDLKKLEVYWQ